MDSYIHTADSHLGYRQYHRPEREQDFLDAFRQVIDAAIEHDVSGIIHAGDLFHDSRPSTRTIRSALEELRRVNQHGIEFGAVVGNHENTRDDQWIDIFSELGLATHLSNTPTVIGDTAFYGIDHVPPSKRDQVSLEFEPVDSEYAMLVTHGLFAPVSPYGTWDIRHLLAQCQIEFDAVLLGDDHTPRIDRVTDIPVTYPGSTERTATDQTADRVCNLITTNGKDDDVRIEPVHLDTRPHIFIQVDLAPGDGTGEIRCRLDQHDVTGAIVAVIVTGDGEDIVPASLEEYGKSQGALVVRVSDRRDTAIDDIDIDVTFADPDDAVQDRISTMDLSVVAYEIEQYVRDIDAYPKSNLTDRVETEISTRIDESPNEFDQEAEIEPPAATRESLAAFSTNQPRGDSDGSQPEDAPKQAADAPGTSREHEDPESRVQVSFEDYSE